MFFWGFFCFFLYNPLGLSCKFGHNINKPRHTSHKTKPDLLRTWYQITCEWNETFPPIFVRCSWSVHILSTTYFTSILQNFHSNNRSINLGHSTWFYYNPDPCGGLDLRLEIAPQPRDLTYTHVWLITIQMGPVSISTSVKLFHTLRTNLPTPVILCNYWTRPSYLLVYITAYSLLHVQVGRFKAERGGTG